MSSSSPRNVQLTPLLLWFNPSPLLLLIVAFVAKSWLIFGLSIIATLLTLLLNRHEMSITAALRFIRLSLLSKRLAIPTYRNGRNDQDG